MSIRREETYYFIKDGAIFLYITDLNDILFYKDAINENIAGDNVTALIIIWNGQDILPGITQSRKKDLYRWLNSLSIPSVVVVNSYCYGDLLELIMMCDIRLGGNNLVIRFPDDETGFIFDFKERCNLLMGIPEGRKSYDDLLKKTMHYKEIYNRRLINKVINMENMLSELQSYINRIMSNKSSYQIKAIMKCFNNYKNLGLDTNRELLLEQESRQFCELVAKEYLKKRK